MIDDADRRRRLARFLGEVVDSIAAKHANRKTQERPITAKIGHGLETSRATIEEALMTSHAKGQPFPPYDVRITVQDIPDSGRGALEEPTGIDLYVNITVRTDGKPKSKGIIIQAKKGRRRDGLTEQCRKMLKLSDDGAYAWIYGEDGCWVINAKTIDATPDTALRQLPRRTPAAVFDAILECSEGDLSLGLPPDVDEDAALDQIQAHLRATALSFRVTDQERPGVSTITIEQRDGPLAR